MRLAARTVPRAQVGGLLVACALTLPVAIWLYTLQTFTSHMLAHLLLTLGAAPLLLAALPGWRPRVPGWLAFVLLNSVIYGLHLPAVSMALMGSAGGVALEALLFLGAGLLFWAAVRRGGGGALALLLVQMLACALLGAAITFARPGTYAMHPAADVSTGGVLMWVLGGAVYMISALVLTGRLLYREAL